MSKRHFGIPNATARSASGGQLPSGPRAALDTHRGSHIARGAQRDMNSVGVLPNSRSQESEPFIHPFEFGAYCLLVAVSLLPSLFVCAAVCLYALFVA